jgi:hypothetical protein
MLSTSKVGRRKSAEGKPSNSSRSLSNNREDSFILECDFRNSQSKLKPQVTLESNFSELIHQIPIVQQTINAQPTRKHDGRIPSSTISPNVVL